MELPCLNKVIVWYRGRQKYTENAKTTEIYKLTQILARYFGLQHKRKKVADLILDDLDSSVSQASPTHAIFI